MQQLIRASSSMNNKVRNMFVTPCSVGTRRNALQDDGNSKAATLCICQVITPVIRYCQFFGVLPVGFHDYSISHHDTNSSRQLYKSRDDGNNPKEVNKNTKECYISSRWISLPSFTNIIFMLSSIVIATWAFTRLHTILAVYFEGTDLYTFGTQTTCLYTQSNLILINAFMQRERFCEVWALLLKILKSLTEEPVNNVNNDDKKLIGGESAKPTICIQSGKSKGATGFNFVAASALLHHLECKGTLNNSVSVGDQQTGDLRTSTTVLLKDQDDNLEKKGHNLRKRLKVLRIFSYVTTVVILITSISHIATFFNLIFHACFDKTVDPGNSVVYGKPPCPLNNFMLFLQKCFYGMIDFVTQGVAILFGTLCLLIYIFFRELEEQLNRLLKSFSEIDKPAVSIQRHSQVEHLRLCYEDLSRLCRLMSQSFGLAIIAALITSVISITCALYSIVLSRAIEKNEAMQMARFYVIWAFHGWFGCFCLFLVLIPGQLITNSSEAPSRVIGSYSLAHLDKETRYQLSQFQHQSRQPVILTACNIANVGLGFISSAATNVTTYMLVILQFRLGVENKKEGITPTPSNGAF